MSLERLQRILCYRELGFGLEDIAAILDDPRSDPIDHLRRRHALLTDQMDRLAVMVVAVTNARPQSSDWPPRWLPDCPRPARRRWLGQ